MSAILELSSWTAFKDLCITKKNLNNQYVDNGRTYELYGPDANDLTWHTSILKTDPANADQTDFEDNHEANFNFAVGNRAYPFSTSDFDFQGNGVLATATKTTTTDIDLVVPSPGMYVNGGEVYAKDAVIGDYIVCQVIDKDNVLGYGANTVLKQWITKWYIIPDTKMELSTPYAGFIPAGVYMRTKYTSIGTTNDVTLLGNYFFHKSI